MSSTRRYLTKSRLKVGTECPTKLYYLDKPEYGNNNADDSFLRALAEGGFQVGELAKIYHPGGIEVVERSNEQAIAKTTELLKQDKITIFEAAISVGDYLVRVDVLKKDGNNIDLIEVKAKSFDSNDETSFFTKRGKRSIRSEWEPYLLDVAFQTFVVRKAFPEFKVKSFLMLADKSKVATVDGLNQRFLIARDENNRSSVTVQAGTDLGSVGEAILCKVNVLEPVTFILEETKYTEGSFEAYAKALSELVTKGKKSTPAITSNCKNCEFRIDPVKFPSDKKSGFVECFSEAIGMKDSDRGRPLVFDIWNFRKAQSLLVAGCNYMDQVLEEDIGIKESDKDGLSSSQRQWMQVEKVKNKDTKPFINIGGLKAEFAGWTYPLHFIDFETTMAALPFNKGRRPYEQIAFQFSHHMLHKDGKIEHKTQYIHEKRGDFPNFDFVRALKAALDKDDGTIFRYSHHENSVLCQIARQLETSDEKDALELNSWIKTITSAKGDDDGKIGWEGKRSMVDLCELVKRYYYSPLTNGSNSIKKVLPAILAESQYLASRYSQPIYGSFDGIKSLNFQDWTWLHRDANGKTLDPYKLLPPIFTEAELEAIEPITNAGEIADGGAAMMAYAMMQFTEMSKVEAEKIRAALLKYCELDTFAMVMIFEHWAELIRMEKTKRIA